MVKNNRSHAALMSFLMLLPLGLNLAVLLALAACSDAEKRQLFGGSPVNATGSKIEVPVASAGMTEYSRRINLYQAQADRLLHEYSLPQSHQAIRSLIVRGELSSPNRIASDREEFDIIPAVNDPVVTPRKLVILYRLSADSNYQQSEAYDWYLQ